MTEEQVEVTPMPGSQVEEKLPVDKSASREEASEAAQGLACPNCGGMVPIPEGQVIVRCPYCDLRSMVKGERGLLRYQVPLKVDREIAEAVLRKFLNSSRAIAGQAVRSAKLTESFVAYLPFWVAWSRVLGWVFGEKKVGSGDDARYEPREVQVVEDMTWNAAACDVGEFGVEAVPRIDPQLEPFDADALHTAGMVFEPVGLLSEARKDAEQEFSRRVEDKANLDRIGQIFVRHLRQRMGIVYYPLWVLRYEYQGRAYQVAVDGYSGQVLYGKAPGSTLFRAAILVGGMALGALIAVDASALAFYFAASFGDDEGGLFFFGLALIGAGIGVMVQAYRKFRYGEIYEFRRQVKRGQSPKGAFSLSDGLRMLKDLSR